jgi:hypothetical protein
MIRAMPVAPPLSPTVRRRAAAAHGLCRLAPLTRSWVGLALIGVVMGTLVLSLPSAWNPSPSAPVFRTVTHETRRPPQDPTFGGDASPSPSPLAAHRAVLHESPGWLSHGCLTRDDCDLEDDPLASMVVTTPGRLCLPPPLTATAISPVPQTFPWPFRWLMRPQHLTYA